MSRKSDSQGTTALRACRLPHASRAVLILCRIGSRNVSFIENTSLANAVAVKVHVLTDAPPSPELKGAIFDVEHDRRDLERSMFRQVTHK